nr:c-type cytochrome [Jiella avicenniae]
MLVGAILIWLAVIGLSVFATRIRPKAYGETAGLRLIVWGGCVFPVVVLTALLVWGLQMMPPMRAEANGPTIAVSGERFWWRVAYGVEGEPGVSKTLPEGGTPSANEIWLPAGQRTELLLGSPDVIHSLWVPSIAGKMDAIPGRVNRLVVEPTKPGVYNGVCAEFCGDAHAQMALRVVVVPADEYEAYVARQGAPASVETGNAGFRAFMQNGCDACHAVRGTGAAGEVGPDLTHLASRRTIAAATLPMSRDNLAEFIGFTHRVKPGVQMPSYGMLAEEEIAAIAGWLETLQ